MRLQFGAYELDEVRGELSHAGEVVAVEGRVLSLLSLLLQNRDRLVSKDEIVDVVWDGRAISDSAISTAIKEARKAVGDDGRRQEVIRTVHGRGFRCVADVRIMPRAKTADSEVVLPETDFLLSLDEGKPSIAVLPFQSLEPSPVCATLAEGVPAELISGLSRLRWIDVVARGSSFRFRDMEHDPARLRDVLRVGYILSGLVNLSDSRVTVTVELTETLQGRAIWGETYRGTSDSVQEIRSDIVGSLVAALETRIPQNEVRTPRFDTTGNLDAWSAYHLGLQHMYRFNRPDNDAAAELFRSAIEREPGFARAHAGLSFTQFQNGFMQYGPERQRAIDAALESAENSLDLDLLDPFANYCMGRVCWLKGDLDGAAGWLDRSVEISPNYAQALYVRGLMDVLSGKGEAARANTIRSMSLSPLDPLHYAMLGTHAQSFVVDGDYEAAAKWSDRGARAPRAHHLLACVAAVAHQLAGDRDRARYWAENARSRRPGMSSEAFFSAFPFAKHASRDEIERALKELGF
ncbi:winged helix-turn-helix domain-containing protein [Defluviimonas sp. D31]|uniref:winged helix-turn-helix domain-containing tetratricopeptide repeat protein n=1 Tax=Defluviimonas sp. D31 TaxID=3083253 RepID=UPI00296F3974|nr:winged helix-turn-helix domain-containing protein [Defluviimonas sp. D31]MDW4551645.1 winged helix-turn-helix domain-containing protein [Defluviimonas sp. D31]